MSEDEKLLIWLTFIPLIVVGLAFIVGSIFGIGI